LVSDWSSDVCSSDLGEVLQRLRRLAPQYPTSDSRCVRTVEFGVLQPAGAVTLHSMSGLARGIVELSYSDEAQQPFRVPAQTCPNRRYAPPTDEDANLGPAVAMSVRHGSRVASFARSTRDAAKAANARTKGFATAAPQWSEWDRAAARTLPYGAKNERPAHVRKSESMADPRIPATLV